MPVSGDARPWCKNGLKISGSYPQFHAADFRGTVSKEVGMRLSNFQRSLAAVLLGNLIYFALMPVLPPIARLGISMWQPRVDLGLVIDFVICSVIYVLLGRFVPEKKRAGHNPHL